MTEKELDDHFTEGVHRVWHEFIKEFMLEERDEFALTGWELMEKVEEWALKWPEDVRITRCDDNMFMSSLIVLIDHKTPTQFMGTTMVTIPQMGSQPQVMFLYPGHREGLREKLREISAAQAAIRCRCPSPVVHEGECLECGGSTKLEC